MRKKPARHLKKWSQEDLRILRREWHVVEPATLCRKLRRVWGGVFRMAVTIKLPFGVPQGYESIRDAAQRTNYTWTGLYALLQREGVQVRMLYSQAGPRIGMIPLRRRYVHPDDVDEAIKHDLAKETATDAARRLRIAFRGLWRLLREAGLLEGVAIKKRIRLPPEVYDRLVAEYRKTPAGRMGAVKAMRNAQRKRAA